MGAFASAAPLEHLEAVAGADELDVLDALAGLLDVALVRRVESGDGRLRFGLPEALRQIAARLLDCAPDGQRWRRAHAEHARDLTWAARTLIVPGPVFREAAEADVEAAAALRWAQAVDDPLARSLGAARAMLLVDTGRLREAISVIGPLVARRSGDPAADSLAFAAQAIALAVNNRMQEAIASSNRSVEIAADADQESLAFALIERGVVQVYRGHAKAALPDHEQATALARHLGPAALAGALSYEAQARIFAGEFERAAEQLEEVRRIGMPADAKAIWHIDTLLGDLAVRSGHPQAALEPYARSLGAAEARGDQLQIFHDLLSLAEALAMTGEDAGALEEVGLSEAQSEDVRGFAGDTTEVLPGRDIGAATRRLGPGLAGELRARGRAVPAGERVMVACRLARTPQAETSS
jgi:tetratricopeptide (TPR) repeat protein